MSINDYIKVNIDFAFPPCFVVHSVEITTRS